MYALCRRIDQLERFIHVIDQNMNKVEQQIVIAQGELGISEPGIGTLFKSVLFGRVGRGGGSGRGSGSNLDEKGEFVPVEILDTASFFKPPEESELETELGIELEELSEDFLNL